MFKSWDIVFSSGNNESRLVTTVAEFPISSSHDPAFKSEKNFPSLPDPSVVKNTERTSFFPSSEVCDTYNSPSKCSSPKVCSDGNLKVTDSAW